MKKQYSPAPWKYEENLDANMSRISSNTNYRLIAGIPNNFTITNNPDELVIQRANANLIVAAPDLLNACEAVLSALDSHQAYDKDMRPELRNAIAKAYGIF